MIRRPGDAGPCCPEVRALPWQRAIDGLAAVSRVLGAPLGHRVAALWLEAVARPEVSRLADRLADARLPRPALRALIKAFTAAFHIDLSEAAEPIEAHRTFNAFFTRRLRAGARPIAPDEAALVSPADARLQSFGAVDPRGRIPEVKGRRFSVRELLSGACDPEPFERGGYAILYLSPRDYHRVHSPVAGQVVRVARVAGASYPVNALGREHIPGLLAVNKRLIFIIDSPRHGLVAAIMVGATNVGRITTTVSEGDALARGDELGVFNLGSTVVLLTAAPGVRVEGAFEGQLLQVGQALMRRRDAPTV